MVFLSAVASASFWWLLRSSPSSGSLPFVLLERCWLACDLLVSFCFPPLSSALSWSAAAIEEEERRGRKEEKFEGSNSDGDDELLLIEGEERRRRKERKRRRRRKRRK